MIDVSGLCECLIDVFFMEMTEAAKTVQSDMYCLNGNEGQLQQTQTNII